MNGTVVVDQVTIPWKAEPIEIRLGTRETFMLRLPEPAENRSSSMLDLPTGGSSNADGNQPSALERL